MLISKLIFFGLKPGRKTALPGLMRVAAAVFTLFLVTIWLGCGETFRPVALPIPQPPPSPQPSHFVASVSTDGASGNGSMSRIDVSGDSVTSTLSIGAAPVHAALNPVGTKIYVANSGEDTVSATSPSSNPITTISLPTQSVAITQTVGTGASATYTYTGATGVFVPGEEVVVSGCTTAGFNGVFTVTSASSGSFSVANSTAASDVPESGGATARSHPHPVFVHTTENVKMYVANWNEGTVDVINTSTDAVVAGVSLIPAAPAPNPAVRPVALAETPDGFRLYSVNQGDGSVSSISTVDDTVQKVIPISASPIWAVARSDSARLYVLDNASGKIFVVDTLSDTVINSSASAGAGANFMFYDRVLNRLYVTNPVAGTLSIFDVSNDPPVERAGSPVPIAASGATCTSAVQPTSVTVLGDGSRAYVASFQRDPNATVCTQASVVDASTSALTKTIPLSVSSEAAQTGCAAARFRVFAASSGGGAGSNFKTYISQCDAGDLSVIATFAVSGGPDPHGADVVEADISPQLSTFPPSQLGISAASQSGTTTTYTYSLTSGSPLQVGETVTITGMSDPGNNGRFVISSLPAAGTFSVSNSLGVTSSNSQTGAGLVLPPQNPVFLVAGP